MSRLEKLGGFSTDYLIGVLDCVIKSKGFNEFFDKNPIKYKRGFLDYVDYCIEKGFIKKKKYDNGRSKYTTTERGKQLLRMIK